MYCTCIVDLHLKSNIYNSVYTSMKCIACVGTYNNYIHNIRVLHDQLNQPVRVYQSWPAKVMVLGHAEMPWSLFVQIILVKMVSILNTIAVYLFELGYACPYLTYT